MSPVKFSDSFNDISWTAKLIFSFLNNGKYILLGAKIKLIFSWFIFIKKLMQDYYQINSKVIFGGNINIDNINSLAKLNVLDGFIICSAILNPENIPIIINQITAQ